MDNPAQHTSDGTREYTQSADDPDRLRHQLELQGAALRETEERCGPLLQRAERELARCTAELEQLAYAASHDLRSPLGTIGGFAHILSQQYAGGLDAEAREYLDYITEGVKRMNALIDDLLAYMRIGSAPTPMEPVDCATVARVAVDDLRAALAESNGTIAIGALPVVPGDARQLGQLFHNLIDNALKFRALAPPEVRVYAERQGAEWLCCVRDNGIGLDPAYAERIFRIFQRLHARDKYAGTGIGLAICQKIVACHGGRIWVESQPNQGAAFKFTLPADPAGLQRCA